MITLRTQPNPAFKIAQPLPMVIGDPAAVRDCAVSFGIARLRHGSADEQEFPAAAPGCGLSNGGGKPHLHALSRSIECW
jgi:hypothetical protein